MNLRDLIQKLQSLSGSQKKTIIVVTVCIVSFVFGFWWVRTSIQRLNKLDRIANIKMPEFNMPQIILPPSQPDQEFLNQIKDWKIYTNEKYGFEIRYPKEWNISTKEKNSQSDFSINITASNYPETPSCKIEFISGDYQKFVESFQKGFEDKIKNNPQQPGGVVNDATFGGIDAKEFLYYSPIGAALQDIIFANNGQIIKISSFKNSIFDPIIATFNFINKK